MASKTVLAIDLGAESGRVTAVSYDGRRLSLKEISRFPNIPVEAGGTIYWDVLNLWRNISEAIAEGHATSPVSVGVDTWGVDFALLDHNGQLMGLPVHYRDGRTKGIMEDVFSVVSRREIFRHTGIQFMPINTLYQIRSLILSDSPALQHAAVFLTIPDLINYWLTGQKISEFTSATTTQLFNTAEHRWATELQEKLDIPTAIFPAVCEPGTPLGTYGALEVIAPACHDTGSAVAAVPSRGKKAVYISSGTWSPVGCEVDEPVLTDAALEAELTNEGGADGAFRLLKNVTGLWILQECQRTWEAEGRPYSYPELTALANQAPALQSIIIPDDPRFLSPGNHPEIIRQFCAHTGQATPDSVGRIVRCVLESLALAYREVIESLEAVTGREFETIHIIGGGSRNELLCQFTADATGLEVVAGPVEAAVIGNALVQLCAIGELASLAEGREIVSRLKELRRYEPRLSPAWAAADGQYRRLREGAAAS